MTLKELLDKLFGDHKLHEIIKELPRGDGTLYQRIFSAGRQAAEKEAGTAAEAARKEQERLEGEVERLEGELATARQGKGDTAELERKHAEAITALKERQKLELKARDEAVDAERVSSTQAQLEAVLIRGDAELGIPQLLPAAARYMARDPEIAKRLKPGKDGVQVLGKDGTALQPGDKGTVLDLLAKELGEAAPAGARLSGADSGSGNDTGAAGGARGQGGKDYYAGIRKGVEEAEKAKAPQGPTLEDRLGLAGVRTPAGA